MDVELVRHLVASVDPAVALHHVSSRVEFLDALQEHRYSLILSDNSVFDLSGHDALRIAARQCPDTPFIFLTGNEHPGAADASMAAGASGHLNKRDTGSLRQMVREHVASSRLESGSPFEAQRASRNLLVAMRDLSNARTIEEVMLVVRSAARRLVSADGATFVLRDGERCFYADEDAIQPLWKGMRFPMTACISGWAMMNRRQAVIQDIFADERIPIDAYSPTFVRSLVMTPVPRKDPVAAIGVYWAKTRRASPEEADLLQMLADSTGVALQNVHLINDLERRVAERTRQLEIANEELAAFSYSISHDLRAPLRAINGFGQILIEDKASKLSPNGADCLKRVASESKRMDRLLDDLLRLFRFSNQDLQVADVDLSAMSLRLADVFSARHPERKVRVEVHENMHVQADGQLLEVVLENLLGNAWKFTGTRDFPSVTIGVDDSADTPIYFVRDNGVGFDMRHVGKLFAPFQRLHSNDEFAGTGVGLATARRIVRRHGGDMWASAEPGRGATFLFTLAPGPSIVPESPLQPNIHPK